MKRYCAKHDAPYESMSGRWRCRKCYYEYQSRYRKGPGAAAERRRQDVKLYGITKDQSDALRNVSSCEVCGSTEKLCIDHDHTTGKIRGVICWSCNVTLGHASDSPELLRKLAAYLEESRG